MAKQTSITIRISDEEKYAITKMCRLKGLKPAQYTRQALFERIAADEKMDHSGLNISKALKLAMEGKLSAYIKKHGDGNDRLQDPGKGQDDEEDEGQDEGAGEDTSSSEDPGAVVGETSGEVDEKDNSGGAETGGEERTTKTPVVTVGT